MLLSYCHCPVSTLCRIYTWTTSYGYIRRNIKKKSTQTTLTKWKNNHKKRKLDTICLSSDAGVLTESNVVSILPLGRSPANVVSFKLSFTWLAAVDVAAPRCGFVASSSTFKEAMACNWVAFSSTLPVTFS